MKFDAILFDLDGTLWDSVDEVIQAWNSVILRYPGLRGPLTRGEQEKLMGLQMDDIARRVFPNVDDKEQLRLMDECVAVENELLARTGAKLYDGLEQMLEVLYEKHTLCIVSNCQLGYIEAFLHAHKLEKYFTDYICFGDTGLRKGESILKLLSRHKFSSPIYVGDTQGDCDEAHYAGLPFVYAEYGMGTSRGEDYRIGKPLDLLNIVMEDC